MSYVFPDVYEIVAVWSAAVVADSGLNDWCEANQGGKPTVWTEADPRREIKFSELPAVCFLGVSSSTGAEVDDAVYTVEIVCAINVRDGGLAESGTGNRVKIYQGVVDATREVASRVLNALIATEYKPDRVDSRVETEGFPAVVARMTVITSIPVTLQGGMGW